HFYFFLSVKAHRTLPPEISEKWASLYRTVRPHSHESALFVQKITGQTAVLSLGTINWIHSLLTFPLLQPLGVNLDFHCLIFHDILLSHHRKGATFLALFSVHD